MNNKIWNYCIGVLDKPNEDEWPYRDSVFINNQDSLQFQIRIISETAYSFPNIKAVTGFYSDLEPWGFEDDYNLDDEKRKNNLKEWLEDYLLVFKVEKRIRYLYIFISPDLCFDFLSLVPITFIVLPQQGQGLLPALLIKNSIVVNYLII